MLNLRTLAVLLLTGSTIAAPRFWSYQSLGTAGKNVQVASALPPGGFVSNGILYLTKTIYVTPGSDTSATAPVLSAPAPAASSPAATQSPDAAVPVASSAAPKAVSPVPSPSTEPQAPVPSVPVSQAPASTSVAPVVNPQPSVAAAAPKTSSTTPIESPAASPSPAPAALPATGNNSLDPSIILAIMPSAGSCANAAFPDQCRTATQGAPFVSGAWAKYGITSKAAQAATLALQAVESGEFKFDHSEFPTPTPGKGTRNMQSPTFNAQYATQLYGAAKVAAAGDPDSVLALVNDDADSFASASWFLATICPNVLSQFATDPELAWTAYLGSGCIGTTSSDQRTQYWNAAKKAFGIS
jgi:hypothetical protein